MISLLLLVDIRENMFFRKKDNNKNFIIFLKFEIFVISRNYSFANVLSNNVLFQHFLLYVYSMTFIYKYNFNSPDMLYIRGIFFFRIFIFDVKLEIQNLCISEI